jgi:hypothetical protein
VFLLSGEWVYISKKIAMMYRRYCEIVLGIFRLIELLFFILFRHHNRKYIYTVSHNMFRLIKPTSGIWHFILTCTRPLVFLHCPMFTYSNAGFLVIYSAVIQGVKKYMLQRSVVDRWVQCDHILLIHPIQITSIYCVQFAIHFRDILNLRVLSSHVPYGSHSIHQEGRDGKQRSSWITKEILDYSPALDICCIC